MIIKARAISSASWLAEHLAAGENERADLVQISGLAGATIAEAMEEIAAIGGASRAAKYVYHASVSPHPDASMTLDDWGRVWAIFERVHGVEGLPFVEVEHEKRGRVHRHRAYSRVDPETGKAAHLSHTLIRNERIARQAEIALGHELTRGRWNRAVLAAFEREALGEYAAAMRHLTEGAPSYAVAQRHEHQQSQRMDARAVRAALVAAWQESDSPAAYEAALAARGLALAAGERVPVVVTPEGEVVPLLRTTNAGLKATGLGRIRADDLTQRLAGLVLAHAEAVIEAQTERQLETRSQQAHHLAEERAMQPQQTQKADEAIETAQISPAKRAPQQRRKRQGTANDEEYPSVPPSPLADRYGAQITASPLIRYWKMERLPDGALRLHNRAGEVVDRGGAVDVTTRGKAHIRTAEAAVELAKLKGWVSITITGTDEFRAAAYRAAIRAGVDVALTNDQDRTLFEAVARRELEAERQQAPEQPAGRIEEGRPGMSVERGLGHTQARSEDSTDTPRPEEAPEPTQQTGPQLR